MKENVQLLILAREFPTHSGPIDALGIDREGDIYIVETKLYRNPDKRTVVAQMLDYGASLWTTYKDFSDFISLLDSEANAKHQRSLNQIIKESFTLDDEGVSVLLENVKHNLASAVFKFVVLMDELDSRLRDLIIFINEKSQFDIYAVELEYYKYQDYEIMIPKLYGAEVKKSPAIASQKIKWDEKTFFDEARSKLSPQQFTAIERVYAFFKNRAEIIDWGTGKTYGSFKPRFYNISNRSPVSITSIGDIWILLSYLTDSGTALKFRDSLKENLQRIKGLDIPPDQGIIKIEANKVADFTDAIIEAFRKSLDSV